MKKETFWAVFAPTGFMLYWTLANTSRGAIRVYTKKTGFKWRFQKELGYHTGQVDVWT